MICEIHILEPRTEEVNARKIIAVTDQVIQLTKESLKIYRLDGIQT